MCVGHIDALDLLRFVGASGCGSDVVVVLGAAVSNGHSCRLGSLLRQKPEKLRVFTEFVNKVNRGAIVIVPEALICTIVEQ